MSRIKPITRGTLSIMEAAIKSTPSSLSINYSNNITMRSMMMVENIPSKEDSVSVEDAHRKSLRLYRRFCRLVPFLLRNHFLEYKTTPALAKQQLATHFRKLAECTDLTELDQQIEEGYEQMLTLEQNYVEPGGAYHELAPLGRQRDCGYSFFNERFKKKNKPASKFLTDLYKLAKDPQS